MEVEFDDVSLGDLEINAQATWKHGDAVDKGFRKKMQILRAAVDERDLRALKSLRFEKLKGERSHQHSVRINDQWRIVIELRKEGARTRLGIISIEDYH
jgi:toxin HigB-1